ncbi:MAG: hypothetical protein ACLGH7_00205, partial [Actinomycetes bacterium]
MEQGRSTPTAPAATTVGETTTDPGRQERPGPDPERLARAALSRLMEPQDVAGLALVKAAGAVDALRIAAGQVAAGEGLEREIT